MKSLILSLTLLLCFSHSAMADSEKKIGPFPAVGTPAEKSDIEQMLFYQATRTPEQCASAESEANASLEAFFGGSHGLLNAAELEEAHAQLRWVTVKAGAKILYYKTKYHRARPYITHPEIKPCIDLENSKSYPSGHATIARVYARLLGIMYPDRKEQFLIRADEVALNRVLGGVHHPSDVEAGKKLGDEIVDDHLNDLESLVVE
jgi:acid phosphatase (class A)